MIRAKAIKGAGIRLRVIGSGIVVVTSVFDLTVGVIVTGLSENAQLWYAEHRVPAHVITHGAAPLKSF